MVGGPDGAVTAHRCGVLLVVLAVGLALGACSAPTTHVSVPAGWKPVSYSGLTIDVPGTWPVYQRSKWPCGIRGPGVLVGHSAPGAARCPAIIGLPLAPVLTFGGPDVVVPVGPEKRSTVNGVEAAVSKLGLFPGVGNGTTSEEVVRFPGHNAWLKATVPGRRSAGVLGVIDQVVRTVRPSK